MIEEKKQIICPFCGGQGKKYRETWIKFIYPLFFLEKNYICNECKEMFNYSHIKGRPFKKKSKHLVSNIAKIFIILFFLWFLYIFSSALL